MIHVQHNTTYTQDTHKCIATQNVCGEELFEKSLPLPLSRQSQVGCTLKYKCGLEIQTRHHRNRLYCMEVVYIFISLVFLCPALVIAPRPESELFDGTVGTAIGVAVSAELFSLP